MELNEQNEIIIDGNPVAFLKGFLIERKQEFLTLLSTEEVKRFLIKRLEEKIDKLISGEDAVLTIGADYKIYFQKEVIASLKKTDDILSLDFDPVMDALIEGIPLARLALHLQSYVKRKMNILTDALNKIRDIKELSENGKKLQALLIHNLGIIERKSHYTLAKSLTDTDKTSFKEAGVRFAQFSIFIKDFMKPAAQKIKWLLWSLYHEKAELLPMPPEGIVNVLVNPDYPSEYYTVIGYRICNQYAVRIDMIEKLADSIRPLATKTNKNPKGEFEILPSHMSFVGKSGMAFEDIMQSMGYDFTQKTLSGPLTKPKEEDNIEITESFKKIWFWKRKEKQASPKNIKRGSEKKPFSKKKNTDKKAKQKPTKTPQDKDRNQYKIKDEHNPFAILSTLKKKD